MVLLKYVIDSCFISGFLSNNSYTSAASTKTSEMPDVGRNCHQNLFMQMSGLGQPSEGRVPPFVFCTVAFVDFINLINDGRLPYFNSLIII